MAADGSGRAQASTAPPRKINVQKFADARAAEIESLHSIVADRLNNDFRSNRSKRRRTTAFDSKAAKNRQRKRRKLAGGLFATRNAPQAAPTAGESEKDQKAVPRRVRRRVELRKNPESGFSVSGDGTKRLRTHVWHAKRFTMTKLWGFHLPLGLHGRGRGSRSVLKGFKNGAVLHDASYYSAVQLEGPEDSLMLIIKNVLVPSPSAEPENISNSIISGAIYGTAMLHRIGPPGSQPISPVTFMWRPCCSVNNENGVKDPDFVDCNKIQGPKLCSPTRQLWVWIHASAFNEGYDALKFACQKQMNESGILVNCFSREGQLAKLEVMGSKAFQHLKMTLRPLSCSSEDTWKLQNCSVVGDDSRLKNSCSLENEDCIPSRSILSLTVEDPRVRPQKKLGDVPVSSVDDVINGRSENGVKDNVTLLGISDKHHKLPAPSCSKPEGSCSFLDEKNLWDAGKAVSPPVEENVLCLERHHSRMDIVCLSDSKSGIPNSSTELQESRSCPIMLIKSSTSTGSLMGWSIILPLSWVRIFWIPFVSRGAHVIGLREKRWVSCEVGLPHFPSDFPDCNAYSLYMASEAAVLDNKAELIPPALRPFKVPIAPPWNIFAAIDEVPSCLTAVLDTQISYEKDVFDANKLPNLNQGDCGSALLSSDYKLFDGVVARTCGMLTDYLNTIHGHRILLFPKVPKGTISELEFMEDESRLGLSRNSIDQITANHKLCFVRVLLHAFKKGVFEEGAVVCAARLSDLSLWTSRCESIVDGLQIPRSSVSSYFKEQFSGKWEVQIPEDPAERISFRWPIGFVTTGFVRGSKKPVAEAFCLAAKLAQLREEQWNEMPLEKRRTEIFVLVRNLRSSAYRLALATIVLEQQQEDLDFL